MPPMRATFFFESGKFGWSETYHTSSGSHAEVLAKAVAIKDLRMRICGPGVTMSYIRVSDDAIQRDALPWSVGLTTVQDADEAAIVADGGGTSIIPIVVDSRADRPYSAVLVRGQGPSNESRNLYMRGVADSIIVHPLGPRAFAGWYDGFNTWASNMVTGGWGFVGTDHSRITYPEIRVSDYGDLTKYFTTVSNPWPEKFKARFSGFKGPHTPNGVRPVKKVSDTQVFIVGDEQTWKISTFGTIRVQQPTFYGFSRLDVRGQTHRDTGGPFDRPRGRRRRR